ncbi:MAG TPA: P-loop NTPase [Bacilli bacterium]|nr:P-loop NTPase [Bacilli bacterium]
MADCNHDCEHCEENCDSRAAPQSLRVNLNTRSKVKHVIGVVSGKGGVGKSLVSSLTAVGLANNGHHVAILDADITGPSIPQAFGIKEKAMGDGELIFPARSEKGIQIISANMLLDNDEDPILWRGTLISNLVKQFFTDVFWDDVDYMIVDLPPGTGDVALTVFQSLPLDGIIVVSTPQQLVETIVKKAVNMAKQMNIPVLGLVENMSYITCPDCGKKIALYGNSQLDVLAGKYNVPLLARLPLVPANATLIDAGLVENTDVEEFAPVIEAIERIK